MSSAAKATDLQSDPATPTPSRVPSPPAVQVRAVYRGVTTHARILTFPTGPKRAGHQFTIGWQAGVDAPVSERFVTWAAHPLVLAAGSDYVVNVTPQMTGQVREHGRVYSLAAFTERRGCTFVLPASGEATLECGASRFVVTRTTAPRALPPPRWRWRWQQHGYTLASGLALALLLVAIAFVPADPKSLALDILGRDGRHIAFLVKPPLPQDEQTLPWLKKATDTPGGKGVQAAGVAGQMGDRTGPKTAGRFAVKRRSDEAELRLSRHQAIEEAKNSGILGVFRRVEGSHITSIFGADSALGQDAQDVIGHLQGAEVANAYGVGGLHVTGTGDGGGETREGVVGVGGLATISGHGGGGLAGRDYGKGVGNLQPRRATTPNIVLGVSTVRGALDKEIVRRVIRLHLNEVKYCYEQELARRPSLGGRVVVHFAISASGQVLTSALQSSTMGNATVETCTVQAVRRWQFPQPQGGGLVLVSYPFVLTPAGN